MADDVQALRLRGNFLEVEHKVKQAWDALASLLRAERRAKPQAAARVMSKAEEGSGTLAKAAARSCSKLVDAPGMGELGREVL